MRIKLFQINKSRDSDRVCFLNLEKMTSMNWASSIYDLVFDAEVCADNLEDVYQRFNIDNRPGGKNFRSMSTSDVVGVLQEDGSWRHFFCDSIGFVEVGFDEEKTGVIPNIGKTMKAVYVEPGKPARVTRIDASLEGIWAAIGCRTFERVSLKSDAYIYCDAEGKNNGSKPNRAIHDSRNGAILDVIHGTFFIAKENYTSLPDDLCERYVKEFSAPERILYLGDSVLVSPM